MFLMVNLNDVVLVLFLVLLEGVLSLENAIVLAMTIKHLPPLERGRALKYGIMSAFLFRFIALFSLNYLLHFTWLKWLGAIYLLWVGIGHFISSPDTVRPHSGGGFWRTVLTVELLDIAFSVDSVFAGVGVSSHLPVVFIGGVLGIIMMRYAAASFVHLIERFKRLETIAYWLVIAIGFKLGVQAYCAV